MPELESISVFPGPLGGVLTSTAYAEGTLYVPVVDVGCAYSGSPIAPELITGAGALVALDATSGKQLGVIDRPAVIALRL